MFQFPVACDTMTVRKNLAFLQHNRGTEPDCIKQYVQSIAQRIGMENERPRMARGVVRKDVNAIQVDEPLNVFAPHMKWSLRTQIKQLHREFGQTMIYGPHDLTEALTFGDKLVVRDDAQAAHLGSPQSCAGRRRRPS